MLILEDKVSFENMVEAGSKVTVWVIFSRIETDVSFFTTLSKY